jgi:hypothetical protein
MGRGIHWDITATDQSRPIATTTAIPIPLRICIPSASRLSLANMTRILFGAPHVRQFTVDRGKFRHPCDARIQSSLRAVRILRPDFTQLTRPA